jgi:DNA-binding IclR family transcriptional regulator
MVRHWQGRMRNVPKYRAPALEKGLDILELLSREESGLGIAEIARRLDRTVGEIFRMIVVLEARGYIAQGAASDRYGLTSLLFEIAHRTPLVRRLTAVAAPVMRRLTAEINQSAHLAVLNEGRVLVVEQVSAPANSSFIVRLGATLDLWRTSSARVILAFLEARERRRVLERFPPPGGVALATVEAELAVIRAAGWEMRESLVVRGVTNISAPVIDHSGQPVAALTVTHVELLADPVPLETCRRALVAAAHSLTASLGGPG